MTPSTSLVVAPDDKYQRDLGVAGAPHLLDRLASILRTSHDFLNCLGPTRGLPARAISIETATMGEKISSPEEFHTPASHFDQDSEDETAETSDTDIDPSQWLAAIKELLKELRLTIFEMVFQNIISGISTIRRPLSLERYSKATIQGLLKRVLAPIHTSWEIREESLGAGVGLVTALIRAMLDGFRGRDGTVNRPGPDEDCDVEFDLFAGLLDRLARMDKRSRTWTYNV